MSTPPRQTTTVCLVGLGNPGDRYADTRHNIGFLVLDRFIERAGVTTIAAMRTYRIADVRVGDTRVLCCKPQTYMNASGEAVAHFLTDTGLTPAHMLIICDDIALPLGALRIRTHGSSGGQRGLESIIVQLGTDRIARMRCGIGPVPEKIPTADFVLGRFLAEERSSATSMVDRACDAIMCYLESGIDHAMTRFNSRSTPAPGISRTDENIPAAVPPLDGDNTSHQQGIDTGAHC